MTNGNIQSLPVLDIDGTQDLQRYFAGCQNVVHFPPRCAVNSFALLKKFDF
ncbi:hypothetical protein [Halioglobus maricola]|uniref:hypothetical protein n=1 Tax=Halioglobus maricola TaxID=2601894 RepID=UPI0012938845|nr:hypothetical protein [Halioglobus maricola]